MKPDSGKTDVHGVIKMTTKQAKALSRKAQGEETRAVLIETGTQLFSIHGYHGVSMRRLASEAGVNLATVSYHFGGKAGLYEAILDFIIASRDSYFPKKEDVRNRFSEIGSDEKARAEGVSWFVRTLGYGMLGREEHFWAVFLLTREMAQPTEQYDKLFNEFFNPSMESLQALVRAAEPNEPDDEDVIITALCIIGMIVKFLEGRSQIIQRLGWEDFKGERLEKLIGVLEKRVRGLLGLPMEKI